MTQVNKDTTLVFGDSIAKGVKDAGGFGGKAIECISPTQVLGNIQEYIAAHPDGQPGSLRDQNVILSSGMSNDPTPAEKNTITKQIQTLKNAGAHVILLSVSKEHDKWAPLNDTLKEIADANQTYFVPLTQTAKDHVHPENYHDLLNKIKSSTGDTSLTLWESTKVHYHSSTQRAADAIRPAPKAQDQPEPPAEPCLPNTNGTPTPPSPVKKKADGSDDSDDDDKGFSWKKLFSGDGIFGFIGAIFSAIFSFLGGIGDSIGSGLKSMFGGLFGGKDDKSSPDNGATRDNANAQGNGAGRGNEITPPAPSAPAHETILTEGAKLFGYLGHETGELASKVGHEARDIGRSLSNHLGHVWNSAKIEYAELREKYHFSNVELGVARQESGGHINANSNVGAHGVMQLMPKTGEELARKKGQVYNPNNVQQNIELGQDYLRQLTAQNHGDVRKALAAYNAGQGAVNKAVQRASLNGDDWLSHMSEQTRNYVPAVLSHARDFERQETAQNARLEYASVNTSSAPLSASRMNDGQQRNALS